MASKTSKNYACRLPIDVGENLEQLADDYGVTMSKMMGATIIAGMERMEGVKNSILMRSALRLAEHLGPSEALRSEIKDINQALAKSQADKSPKLFKELGLE